MEFTEGEYLIKQLKVVSKSVGLASITEFISIMLPKLINHRNHLKYYRSVIHEFKELFDTLFIEKDFSEKLSTLVKYEPQSLHWSHEQTTVHSGLMKHNGEESYHPYFHMSKHLLSRFSGKY